MCSCWLHCDKVLAQLLTVAKKVLLLSSLCLTEVWDCIGNRACQEPSQHYL